VSSECDTLRIGIAPILELLASPPAISVAASNSARLVIAAEVKVALMVVVTA
jgi:hypothetical protein